MKYILSQPNLPDLEILEEPVYLIPEEHRLRTMARSSMVILVNLVDPCDNRASANNPHRGRIYLDQDGKTCFHSIDRGTSYSIDPTSKRALWNIINWKETK